jgi:hypothetical protein
LKRSFLFLLFIFCLAAFDVCGQDENSGDKNAVTEAEPDMALIWKHDRTPRQGWVIDYLDLHWREVPEEKSYYCRYTFYYNGNSYDPVTLKGNEYTIKASNGVPPAKAGNPVELDGKYSIYDKDGKLVDEVSYTYGYRSGVHKIYKEGKLEFEADFDKKFNCYQPYSYRIIWYKKDGTVRSTGYFCNDNRGKKNGYYIFPE